MDDIDNMIIQKTLLDPRSEERSDDDDLKEKIYQESKKIWRVALPSVISRVASFGTIVVTQSFMGHISSTHLAAYALGQTLTVRFVNGIVICVMITNLGCLIMYLIIIGHMIRVVRRGSHYCRDWDHVTNGSIWI